MTRNAISMFSCSFSPALVSFGQCARVLLAAQFFELIKDWAKDVGVVIGDRSGEIGEIFCALNDCCDAFETHSGIDVTLRQRHKRAIRIRVELDENEIPNLDATRISFIHQRATRVAVRRKIDVNLRAGPARTGVAHHPKIICPATVQNVNLRIEISFAKQMHPVIVALPGQTHLARPGRADKPSHKAVGAEISNARRVAPKPTR